MSDIMICDDHWEDDYEEDMACFADLDQRKLRNLAAITIVTTAIAALCIPMEPPRIGNSRSDRQSALQYVRSWDDDMFRRQFRLCREDFGALLGKISPLTIRNEAKAISSSGSSISPELRLMITLRILAGAKYLDMIWYRVNVELNHKSPSIYQNTTLIVTIDN